MTTIAIDARPQWSSSTCGPAALRCALLCYGDKVDGRKLARLAGTTSDGTCEHGLIAAAEIFGLKVRQEIIRNEATCALRVKEHLHDGKPILVCVDHWEHWTALVPHGRYGSTQRHVWLADPARDGEEVVRRYTWRQFLRRAHWGLADEVRWDLYVLELT